MNPDQPQQPQQPTPPQPQVVPPQAPAQPAAPAAAPALTQAQATQSAQSPIVGEPAQVQPQASVVFAQSVANVGGSTGGEETVPHEWPGAFGLYKYSKDAVKFNVGTLIGLWVLTIIVGIIPEFFEGSLNSILSFVTSVISIVFTLAIAYTVLKGVSREKASFGEAIAKSLPLFVKGLLSTIVTIILVVLSIILLFIPFFIVFPRLVLSTYFIVDKNLGPIEAIKASWTATKGYAMKIWGIIGVNFLFGIIAITIIGIPFAIYLLLMYSASTALIYRFIEREKLATPFSPIS